MKRIQKVMFGLLAVIALSIALSTTALTNELLRTKSVSTNGSWSSWTTVNGLGCNSTCVNVTGRYRGRFNAGTRNVSAESEANVMNSTPIRAQSRAGARMGTATWDADHIWRNAYVISMVTSAQGTGSPWVMIQVRPTFPN